MKIQEIGRTSTFAWSHDALPLLATASVAGAVDLDFSAAASLEIWNIFGPHAGKPLFSAQLDTKFHALAWLRPCDGHPHGVIVGALESGALEFWDAAKLVAGQPLAAALLHRLEKHTGAVRCLQFNAHQPHVLASGGPRGEIYVWDVRTFTEPFSPGRAVSPADDVTSLAWNKAVSHILASTSSGHTSIWDLKAKREVLHLSYNSGLGHADFSAVAWHPQQLTRLATASQSDSCAAVLVWDLRNTSEPAHVLPAAKGVLSVDWCAQDPSLLLASGKDTTRLWNPETGVKIGEYASAANWTFLARFAPHAPDVLACALFDGKIVVQSLHDTTPPAEPVRTDDTDFWLSVAAADTSRPVFDVIQAPRWMQRPCLATFGFGSKLVAVRTENGRSTVSVQTFAEATLDVTQLTQAVLTDDPQSLLTVQREQADAADWELLRQWAEKRQNFFKSAQDNEEKANGEKSNGVQESNGANTESEKANGADIEGDGDFFSHLATPQSYAPSGEFRIADADARLARLILANKLEEAVKMCLAEGKIQHAFALALDQGPHVKDLVRSHFLRENASDVAARLIYAASAHDVIDMVTNADLADWREIALGITSFCADDEFGPKMVELGDRLFTLHSAGARENALACYLVGGAVDKAASLWLDGLPALEKQLLASPDSSVTSAYDARYAALSLFAEKLFVYRGLSHINGPLEGPAAAPVCKAVMEFANMSTAGGHFEVASRFLELLPEEVLRAERERIATAMGKNVHPTNATLSASGLRQVHPSARRSTPGADSARRVSYTPDTRRSSHAPTLPTIPTGQTLAPLVPLTQPVTAQSQTHRKPRARYAAPQETRRSSVPANLRSNPYAPANADNKGSAPVNPTPGLTPENSTSGFTPVNGTSGFAPGNATAGFTPANATSSYVPPKATHNAYTPAAPAAPFTPGAPFTPTATSAVPPPPTTAPQRYKVETDGWNDLPDAFKPKAARRAAPPVVAPPSPAPPVAPKVQASPLMPPPPKLVSRTASRSVSAVLPAQSRAALQPPSKYAPPPSANNAPTANTPPSQTMATPPASSAPRNPYAPPPRVATPKLSYAPPPRNNFAPGPASPAHSAVQPAPNPYAPPAAVSTPPLGVLPPPAHNLGHSRTPSNLSLSRAGQLAPPRNSPLAPPIKSAPPTGLVAPPQSAAAAAPPPPPPASGPTGSVAPTGVLAPSGALAPAGALALPQPHAPPMRHPSAPPKHSAPPMRQPSAPPMRQPSAPPMRQPSAPPVRQPPAQPQPVQTPNPSQPPSRKVSVSHGDRSQIPPESQPIFVGFTRIMESIKPAAPAKYSKHVADMDKRLNILFDILNKRSLSPGAVNLLNMVVEALTAKDYAKATEISNDILAQHGSEVGDWHTGVKRLVTMAEAFDV